MVALPLGVGSNIETIRRLARERGGEEFDMVVSGATQAEMTEVAYDLAEDGFIIAVGQEGEDWRLSKTRSRFD